MTFTTPTQSCTPRKPRSTALTRAAALLVLAAGLLGGCAREFPEVPMSAADAKFAKDLAGQTDPDSRLAYGKLMFMHNHIDEADAALAPLSKAEPDNAEALAWRAANDCKIAGRRGPWLMGFDKLWLVRNCLDDLDRAGKLAPQDFTVALVRMRTGAEVNVMGSLDTAKSIRTDLAPKLATLPASARAAYLIASARIEAADGKPAEERKLLEQAAALNADAQSVAEAKMLMGAAKG